MTTEDSYTLALLPIITWDPDTGQLLFDLAEPLGKHPRVGITLSIAEDVVTHGLEALHIGSGTDFYGSVARSSSTRSSPASSPSSSATASRSAGW